MRWLLRYNGKVLCIFLAAIFAVVALAGCGPRLQKPIRICQGAGDVGKALDGYAQDVRPIRASGQCRLEYYDVDGKNRKENFPIRLWIDPPSRVCMFGDVAFDGRGIILGCNDREFWLSIKPGAETYWWGRWHEQETSGRGCFEGLILNPQNLLDALSVSSSELIGVRQQDWILSNEGQFDILTLRDSAGNVIKKIYIYCCDNFVRRIEYFDASGNAAIVMELDNYRQVSDGFAVPYLIKVSRHTGGETAETLRITLKSVRLAVLSEKKRSYLFVRPKPNGVKHIFKLNADCEFAEQLQ